MQPVKEQLFSFDDSEFLSSFECSLLSPQTCITLFVGEPKFCQFLGCLKCKNYVDDIMISGQILVSTKLYVVPYLVSHLEFFLIFCSTSTSAGKELHNTNWIG